MSANRNKKVLVTGAAGFIGSHLTEALVRKGYKVKAFIRYNSRNFWGWLEDSRCRDDLEIVCGDIRNTDCVKSALKDIDVIFHLAALIGIPYSYSSPDSYVDTNIRGTMNILQAARELKISRLVHTSTSEIYGTAQKVPIREDHPISPQSPYAASKSAADLMAISFCRSFDLPVAIVRPFNTYGPRQSNRAIIPTIITQLLSKNGTVRIGSLFPTRDFTYVQDIVEGFMKAAENEDAVGQVINLGSNSEISIKELIELISGIIEIKPKIITDDKRKRPIVSEVERLLADNTKAKKILGWRPKYNLREGLKETIDWFKAHKGTYKADIYNV
jgi:NAD dependent epimerase/dehydratase